MKIQLLSDIHLEFNDFTPPLTDAGVVVLAGDIAPKLGGVRWAMEKFPDQHVIYVCGNHEFYSWKIDAGLEKMRAETKGTNVHLLEYDEVILDGVRFVGCTAWTDFALWGDRKWAMHACQLGMNDYRKIRVASGGYRRLRASDTAALAQRAQSWIAERLATPHGGPTVVVTHHAPSPLSLLWGEDADAQSDPHGPAYASRWEHLMPGVDLWLHGHTHLAVDYKVGDCRVVSNPRGYGMGDETGYDPELVLEL